MKQFGFACFGENMRDKVEHRRRGVKLGTAPNSPDDWGAATCRWWIRGEIDSFAAWRQMARCAFELLNSLFICTLQSSILALEATNKKTPARGAFLLVDPRRIELLSENPFTGPSSWVVYDLKFPPGVGHRQSTPIGSPFLHDRYKCELPMHVHHCMTLRPRPWYSSGNGRLKSRGTA